MVYPLKTILFIHMGHIQSVDGFKQKLHAFGGARRVLPRCCVPSDGPCATSSLIELMGDPKVHGQRLISE